MRTRINWQLNNYCTGGCSYCPTRFWGGEKPPMVDRFLEITRRIIDHYKQLGRDIDWNFTGGEPLEFFDLPAVMKMCKESNGTIELQTNGGKLWLDWWAIEPHVDNLHLTYHYWQNPNLIKFIIQAFRGKNKNFDITVPIRHDYFDDDWGRALQVETDFEIRVSKQPLYKDASADLYPYTRDQLVKLFGEQWTDLYLNAKPVTFHEQREAIIAVSPSFTNQRCNVGIETLSIGSEGWLSGSDCGIKHMGNVWKDDFTLPNEPTMCDRTVCASGSDQAITKFT